jgi:hypothetical protein
MKAYIFSLVIFFCFEGTAQNLDSTITYLANDIAKKASKKNLVKLALADFINNNGKTDYLTEYVRGELEDRLVNADNIQVLKRTDLNKILKENHLQSEGVINESSVKSAVSFTKIEGLVLGEITYIGDRVKIKIAITSIETSLIYVSSTSGLVDDVAINDLLKRKEK